MGKKKTMQRKKVGNSKLSIMDKQLLHAIEPIVEAIAKIFGNNCEVVLHSIEDLEHSVIKIENGHVTGREKGAPLTDFGIKMLEGANSLSSDVTETYYAKTKDGKTLKSVTVLIRNDKRKPIGFLCINVNLSVPLIDLLQNFLPSPRISVKTTEHFVSNTQELIDNTLSKAISKVNKEKGISNLEKNKFVVFELYSKGIFDIKNAVGIVAQEIGVSRYTVYNYIREAKVKLNKSKKETNCEKVR